MSLREQYPGLAPTDAVECLQDIQNTYSLFMEGITERTEALALDELVELANSQQISFSRYVKPVDGCRGSLSAMSDIIGFHNELRPNDPQELLRDQVASRLEEAAQLVVSRQIVDKVIKEIDSPVEISDATLTSLQDYSPYSLAVLESTARSLSDAHVGRYQSGRDDRITTNSALAFAHLAASQKIIISNGSKTEEISLRQYKLDLVLKERADLTEYLHKTGGNDVGARTIVKGIDDLAVRALEVLITDAHRPSLVRSGIAATSKITIETAQVAVRNKRKAAAVVALSGMAIGLVGVQPAAAKSNHNKAQNWVKKVNDGNNYHTPTTDSISKHAGPKPTSLHAKSQGKHAKETKEHKAVNEEVYKGHKLTPEIREALNEIIARDNPWKNRGIATLFFMERNFTLEQASGMVGSFMVESKMPGSNIDVNPRARQGGNGPGRGIAQTEKKHGDKGGRWDELVQFAIRHNMDPWELNTQLEFVMYEFDHKEHRAYNAMRHSYSVPDTSKAFVDEFERAGAPAYKRRRDNAQLVFDQVLKIANRNSERSRSPEQPKPPVAPPTSAVAPPNEGSPIIPDPSANAPAPIVTPSPETPIMPDNSENAPVVPDESQPVYPMDSYFPAPPIFRENSPITSAESPLGDSPLIVDATLSEDAAPVYAFAPVFTAAPAPLPAEAFTIPDPTISVPAEPMPIVNVPPSAAPEESTPILVITSEPETSTPPVAPEQQPMTPGQIPPVVTLPALPNFPTWAPPVANTPPSVPLNPIQIGPESPILTPTPDPIAPITVPTPPEAIPDPTPPVSVPTPPENIPPQDEAPVIPAPIIEQPPQINAPVVPAPLPPEVQPPETDAPVIPLPPQDEAPVIPAPTPPEVQPPQDSNPPQHEDPPKEEQKPKEDAPKQDDPPKDDKKRDEKPKDDNSNGPNINIDESASDCAPGTVSLGKQKVNDGKAELCAVLGLKSSSQESDPSDHYYVKGANGHAIISAGRSDNIVKLLDRAEKDGINLKAVSSFRTYQHQKELCDADPNGCREGHNRFVAQEGDSMHGEGDAIDFNVIGAKKDNCTWDNNICTAPHDKEWRWLIDNAPDFGFFQYSQEAWHFDTTHH